MSTGTFLRKVAQLRTIVKNYDLETVTVFSRTVHGYRRDGTVSKVQVADRWYEVYEGEVETYPKPLRENEETVLLVPKYILSNVYAIVIKKSPNAKYLPL